MYSDKLLELKKINKEFLENIAKDMPASSDGENAVFEIRDELRGGKGELLTEAAPNCTYFGEIAFKLEGASGDEEMVFSYSLILGEDGYDAEQLAQEQEKLKADTTRFFEELSGNAHKEYFETLIKEREAELMPKEEEKSPFDYKKFIIGASAVAIVAILAVIFINKLLPMLLS